MPRYFIRHSSITVFETNSLVSKWLSIMIASFKSGRNCSWFWMLPQSAIMSYSRGNRCTEHFYWMCSSSCSQLPICLAFRAQLHTSADCLKPTVKKEMQSLVLKGCQLSDPLLCIYPWGCQDHALMVKKKKENKKELNESVINGRMYYGSLLHSCNFLVIFLRQTLVKTH